MGFEEQLNFETKIFTYLWTKDKNTLPFNYLCPVCSTITEIIENDMTKTYDCSNKDCNYKLKFTGV